MNTRTWWSEYQFQKQMSNLWYKAYVSLRKKEKFPDRIEWIDQSTNGYLNKDFNGYTWVKYAKDAIPKTGFLCLFENVNRIIIKDDPLPAKPGKEMTIQGSTGDIWIPDMYYMPKWDLPTGMVHEAFHILQYKMGMFYKTPFPDIEKQTFAIQQCASINLGYSIETDNLFTRNPLAKSLLGL